jgi:EAL domain-containing protein (putative c-di-GMP-specific phosphodiesterase class I)
VRFPVHTLKVDRSFVNEMSSSKASREVVKGLIRMAHSLSMRVVAEGAETDQQIAMLEQMQCDEVQGYGYARPMPFDKFCDFVREHRRPTGPDPFVL